MQMETIVRSARRGQATGNRSKHALIGFVGDLSSSLFGTARESDVKNIRDAQNLLAGKMETIVRSQNKLVAVINLLRRGQAIIRKKVNEISSPMPKLRTLPSGTSPWFSVPFGENWRSKRT